MQRVIVTGGATGIGAAITKELLAHEAHVAVVQRTPNELSAAVAEAGLTGRVIEIAADLSTADGCHQAVDSAAQALGGLDVLVNCAAVTGPAAQRTVAEMDDDYIDAVVDLNLKAVARCSVHAAQRMGSGAVIVSIGSALAHSPLARSALYGATKAAVSALTKGLAVELGERGIRVVTVIPGDIATSVSIPPPPAGLAPTTRIPLLGRRGDPVDIAHVVRFLIGNEASYITGTEVLVDGGFLLGAARGSQ